MQLTVISILVVFLQEPTLARCGRVAGQTWGGAFKPTGLNTIIRNQCITSNGGGFFHHRGTEEGRATSKLVAEVAGPVTSRAVLALLLKVHFCFKFSFLIFSLFLQSVGHSKVLTCSQRQLNKMEASLAACVRKVRHRLSLSFHHLTIFLSTTRCNTSSPADRPTHTKCASGSRLSLTHAQQIYLVGCCNINQNLIVGNISGTCFTRAGVSSISLEQQRHIERTGIGKRCDNQSVGSYHRTILQQNESPLQLTYSDYLKSVLSKLR